MRRLLLIVAIILLFGFATNSNSNTEEFSFIDHLQSGFTNIMEHVDLEEVKNNLNSFFQIIIGEVNQFLNKDTQIEQQETEKLELALPENQAFSIVNLELGQKHEEVKILYGEPERVSMNEYGTNWHTYHDHYQNFFLVTYNSNNEIAGLFTNQDLISSSLGIQMGTSKNEVRQILGEPLSTIQKGLVFYNLPNDREYDVYEKDNSFITIFYDEHLNNTVTAIQLISKSLESEKTNIYTEQNAELTEGFEYQLFDLTNAERVKHGMSILTWDEHVRITARNHSIDMADNAFFDHTNLEGQDPFERMKEDQIHFILAGENLAYGQFSSIFAHEGLLNSLGHRENMLKSDFEYLGVGVAFNDENQPYFTQKFYTK